MQIFTQRNPLRSDPGSSLRQERQFPPHHVYRGADGRVVEVKSFRPQGFTFFIVHTGVGRGAGTITVVRNRVQAGAGIVVEGDPKTLSSRRTLPFDDGLVGVLRRASARYAEERLALGADHADSGYVAVNEAGQPYTPDTLTRMWHKLTKTAGVRPVRLHDARHSCGTALHLRGVPLAVIAKWLGHAIVYGIHRCAHGHGDDLPDGYELMPYAEPIARTRMHHGTIRLSAAAVLGLLAVAVFAPENAGQVIPDGYQLRLHQHTFFIAAWWGRQDGFGEIIGPIRSQSPSVTINFAHWWDNWKPL